MINLRPDIRKPVHRLVDYLYDDERKHLINSIEDDELAERLEAGSDKELFKHCVENDIDHIWLDVYMAQQLNRILYDEATDLEK